MHDYEAETADQICAAESEVVRLRAELAAVDAAIRGKPVPEGASELVQHVARLHKALHDLSYWARRFETEPQGVGLDAVERRLAQHREIADRVLLARSVKPRSAPLAENDGLTAEDRAAGWRWQTAYGVWHLYTPIGVLAAVVDDEGWVARVRGPETGAAGQRAAVRALRKAGALSGGERSGT